MADLVAKDLNLALAMAHDVRVSLPAVALTSQFVELPYYRPGDTTPVT